MYYRGRARHRLVERDEGLLAPNLDADQRQRVLACLRDDFREGAIRSGHAIADDGEESVQLIVLESDRPRQLAERWEGLSAGARVISARSAARHYGLHPAGAVVEVVWD